MLQINVTLAQVTIVAFEGVSRCTFLIIEATSTRSASLEVYSVYLWFYCNVIFGGNPFFS